MAQLSGADEDGRALGVAVFAHDEEARIGAALAALASAGLGPRDRVHVLVNGSTDGTEALVRALAREDGRIVPEVIALGDKSNAWNLYVHTLAEEDRDHLFMDGDVLPAAGAVTAMRASARAHPQALAVSCLPRGGRNSARWGRQILAAHGLPGNLYLLPAATLRRLREAGFVLPVGLVGDDTFLRWSLVRDLDAAAAVDVTRIRPCPDAFFEYASFPLTSLSGLGALLKRHRRYARRDLEMQLLTRHLAANGMAAIPPFVSDLYAEARPWTALSGRWRLRSLLAFDAYRHARRHRGRRPQGSPFLVGTAGKG